MKTILTLLFILLLTITKGYSQVAFQVISNPCNPSLEQSFPFVCAGELNGSGTDWNTPDMTNPSNAIQGELVFVNDGSTPGVFTNIGTPPISVETTTDACENTLWTQDLTGKIAVIWRGGCEFSCKTENAQSRGAIGVIIINHTGEATGMAGGTCGLNVTIPVIMIGRSDGELLMNCISSGGMIGFFGEIIGHFANNLGSSKAEILMTENSAIPRDLAQNGTEYPVDFGLWVRNKGTDPQNGVSASVNVTFNGNSVYSQTSSPINFNVLDTQYIDLGTFAPTSWNVGSYSVTYTINNIDDQFLSDNTFSFEFKFTDNEAVYAKSRLDSFNQPIHNTAYSLNEGPIYDNFESCIVFKNEFAGSRNALVTGMTFSSSPTGFSIANQYIEIRAYQWNDVFTNINSPETYNSLLLLDSSIYIYSDNTLIDSNIFLTFNTPIALQNNQRYLFCVLNPHDSLRTSYNTQLDYTSTLNYYLQPIAPVKTLFSGQTPAWYSYGFGLDAIPAISVTMDITTNINEAKVETTSNPYPNPATNLLTIPLRKHETGNVKIEVFDVLGKIMLSENQTLDNEPLKLNVASIKNGNYLFKLTFSDGTSDVFKVSVNR
ncbi:MAG: T9SS type A sorting domain-containing protein [Flavobacteriales bacterium]|nr:T9SS type A sorting domain-containing protein [Flavobacteriales bacterium]